MAWSLHLFFNVTFLLWAYTFLKTECPLANALLFLLCDFLKWLQKFFVVVYVMTVTVLCPNVCVFLPIVIFVSYFNVIPSGYLLDYHSFARTICYFLVYSLKFCFCCSPLIFLLLKYLFIEARWFHKIKQKRNGPFPGPRLKKQSYVVTFQI